MNQLFDLSGKTAIVTGGGTGIGRGVALGLAGAGANIFLVEHESKNDTLQECRALGVKAESTRADLSSVKSIEQVMAKAIELFGKVDILVNNAGIIRRTTGLECTEKDWDDVMDVNAKAVFFLSQAAARDMVKRKYGKIINIASLLSFQGGVFVSTYAASKGAVAQITKALSNEWAPLGLCVNAIAPGYTITKNTKPLQEDPVRHKAILERIPAGRWGNPEDLQGAAIFLASSASDYVHGQILAVDGGWLSR